MIVISKRNFLVIAGLLISFLCGCLFVSLDHDWIDLSCFNVYTAAMPSVILDDQGAVIAQFQLYKSSPIPFDKLPRVLVQAFVAAEDHSFFDHPGLSLRGIIRSTLVNLYHRRVVQGASTITQQLAKLMFLSNERKFMRKFHEAFLAFQLERQLSKEQIFELYLNNIYFGRGIYGVQAACKHFWNTTLDVLTLDQAATLAAMAKSAFLYSPIKAPSNSKNRRNWVLHNMFKLGFISNEQQQQALAVPIQLQDHAIDSSMRGYIKEYVRVWAEEEYGKEALYTQGYRIKTTINMFTQEKAEAAFNSVVYQLRTKIGTQLNGGLLSIEPQTGHIKAMIGGYDFRQSQFNRAIQASRQMGSSFKPILYALAIKMNISMETVFVDEPFELVMPHGAVWRPNNWTHTFDGPMTLVRALTFSNNIIAIKLFLQLGAENVAQWASLFGVVRSLSLYPSAALGTPEVTVMDNVAAFNVFANNGIYVKPMMIEWVKDRFGNKVWQSRSQSRRIIDPIVTSKMVNVLSQRMILAKKQHADWFDADAIGKTGSTNGAATTWFVGATPGLTTAVYVGRDDNKPMGSQLLAGRTTFPLWISYYKQLKHQKKHFYTDPSLKPVIIDWVTGQRSYEGAPDAISLLQ